MSKIIEVKCPSGMAGEIRALTVKEANVMAQATKRKAQDVIDRVMTSCWVGTDDQGPYDFGEADDSKPRWDDVLMGDTQYILIKLREVTHGADYRFRYQCTAPECREMFWWSVDLVDDLRMQPLAKDDLALFKAGNKFDVDIGGRRISFCLPTGIIAKRAGKRRAQSRQELVTLALRTRIMAIEGVEKANLKKHIDELDLADAMDLIAEFDEHGCGVDDEIEIECEVCGCIMEVQLPFVGEFFYPTGKASRRGRSKDQSDTSLA